VITATDLEVRAGARTLLSTDGAALRVQPGDRIGLVGRNGAGKTTTMRILAGEGEPYAGSIARSGKSVICHRIPKKATSRSWPATGCCPPAASTLCLPTSKSSRR
jgi:ATPase subunit of ABC transporter with duplicated ATPase domains